ncbi:MAG: LapA family protein [Actinobacteria bacterium]|nr:LapA family protein [Actinomycetota bacterium]
MGPQEKKPTNWRAWIIGILIALVVVVCLQNSQQVSVEVLFASFDAPLIVILVAFTLIGMLIGYIGPVYRRHRREEKRAAGQELEKKG